MRTYARILSVAAPVALVAGTVALGSSATAAAKSATATTKAAGKAAGAGVTALAPGAARVPVVVFLKSQGNPGSGPGRSGESLAAAEAPYLSAARQAGATDIRAYHLVGAFAATMSQGEAGKLAASPGVARVIPDSPIVGPDPVSGNPAPGGPAPGITAPAAPGTAAPAPKTPVVKAPAPKTPVVHTPAPKTSVVHTPAPKVPVVKAPAPKTPAAVPGACSVNPQLEPEGLSLTGTASSDPTARTARRLGYTGAGVTVAFLAGGIDTGNVNLMRNGRSVITDYEDFSGDGIGARTGGGEAFLDANAIAGQGEHTYDVRGFSSLSPATPCPVRIAGVAPAADVAALKVFGADGITTTSAYLQAIDYAVTSDHVNVIDESFGASPFPDAASLEAVKEFNDAASAAGTTVVVAGGGAGRFTAVGTPAADPDVVSVGATTDFRFYAQTGYAGANLFARNGWLDNNISSLSSGGYTPQGGTVDMVAPGDLGFASCTADPSMYSDCVNFLGKPSGIEAGGGAGASAAEVTGAAALVIQAYRKAHHGASPSPAAVKQILTSTATDLGAPATQQGSGMLNSLKAVELAAWMPHCDPSGQTLRLSSSQLNAVALAGTKQSWRVTVTNTGATRQTVTLAGRASGASRVVKSGSVTLSDKTSGHFTGWRGAAGNYGAVTFTVPPGQARLNASIAWPAATAVRSGPDTGVRLVLVTPSGQFAGGSLPREVAGYGSAEVLHPAPGRWTAVILSDKAAAGGTTGKVQFGASVAGYAPFGSVRPSALAIQPGASSTFTFTTTIPNDSGDSSGAVILDSPAGTASIPVTLRGMVPVPAGPATGPATGSGVGRGPARSGAFGGELTGGALAGGGGQGSATGQVSAHEFTVPSGTKSIEADVTLARTPAAPVVSYLVAPGGQTVGYGSNGLTTGFTGGRVPVESPRRQLSAYAVNPAAGTWTFVVGFAQPVPASEPADAFTGVIRFNSTRAARGALPSSAATVLTRGKSYSYPIAITNTGAAPEDVFLDARLASLATYTLQPQDKVTGVSLPLRGTAAPPEWIVPTMTQSVTVGATSKVPVTFGFGPFPAAPEPASGTGPLATASYPGSMPYPAVTLPTPVTPGLWDALPAETGPYPAGGTPSASAAMSMTARAEAFDTAVTSPVGDFWKFAAEPMASSTSYRLFVLNPGQTRVIDATIRPDAAPGTLVKGTLYVDDFEDSLAFLAGSQLTSLPYEYKVG